MRLPVTITTVGLLLGACTTDHVVLRPNPSRQFAIACGAALGWSICHRRANELCPAGYNTLSQDAGFNRKELTIACPDAPSASVRSAYAQCTYEASAATVILQRDRDREQDRLFRQCMAARAAGMGRAGP